VLRVPFSLHLSTTHLHPAMKLLTHNMLASHVKGVSETFPLRIEAEKVC